MPKGKFLAFDGPGGSGIDTQLRRLREKFPSDKSFRIHEPGGTDFAGQVRGLLRGESAESTPTVKDAVGRLLDEGINVALSGYAASAWAFQICGEEQRQLEPLFRTIYTAVPGMLIPDAYIIFDLQPQTALARMKARAEEARAQGQAEFEIKSFKYHLRVWEGFREFGALARETGSQYFIIDAGQDEVATHEDLWRRVREALGP